MLAKFIHDDLSRCRRKITSRKYSPMPLVLPVAFIQEQKATTQKIAAHCKKLVSEVTFIKTEIELEKIKKKTKMRKTAFIPNPSPVKEFLTPRRPRPHSQEKQNTQDENLKKSVPLCLTNLALKKELGQGGFSINYTQMSFSKPIHSSRR